MNDRGASRKRKRRRDAANPDDGCEQIAKGVDRRDEGGGPEATSALIGTTKSFYISTMTDVVSKWLQAIQAHCKLASFPALHSSSEKSA
jgi:hypothetical protein